MPREPRLTERFVLDRKIRFSHCDPAGLLSVPRFFDLVNDAVEDWFGEGLGVPFAAFLLEHGYGNPIVSTQCEFLAPVRFGERLALELAPTRIGRSSLRMRLTGHVGSDKRIRARHATSIISRATGRSVEMPPELRSRAERYLQEAEEDKPIVPAGPVPSHAFRSRQLVRYGHCDPGGAVYFARLFDLFQAVLEDWFAEALGCPWNAQFRPQTLAASAQFSAPTRVGDWLDFALWVERLERDSVSVALAGSGAGEERMRVGWRLALGSAKLAARMERFAGTAL